jgi:ribosomal subunit interface protein
MIQLQTTGRHFELDAKIEDYIEQKLGRLDRYLPRKTRDGLSGAVVLEAHESLPQAERCQCEVKIEYRGERLYASESTVNMYAAIDICEQKLKSQILTYKSKHEPAKNRRQRLIAKVLGRAPEPSDPAEEAS